MSAAGWSATSELMMTAKTNPIYDVTRSEMMDKWALAFAFLLGTGGIFILKFYETDPFLVVLWSAFILLAYAAAARWVGRQRIEVETIGDNCYYLGFVLTLVSLASTLYLLVRAGGQTEVIRDVISGFGVALTSTILGIILRVLHIRMSPDMASLDRQTRIELHAAVRNFRTNLSASLRELKHFSVETAQMLSEQRDAIRGASKEVIESQQQILTVSVEEQMRMMNDMIAAETDKATQKISNAVANSVAASQENLFTSVTEMREAVADLARKESEILNKLIEDSTGISSESGKIQTALIELADRLEVVSANLDSVAKNVSNELEPAAINIANTIVDAANTTRELEVELKNARRGNGFWGRWRSR